MNLVKDIEQTKQTVRQICDNLEDKIPLEARNSVEEVILRMKTESLSLKDALQISDEFCEIAHQYGYNLFKAGKYPEAIKIFEWLRVIDATTLRYSFAIACCYHYSKDYLNAAAYYMMCNVLNAADPIPYFHLCDCFVKSGYLYSALQAIQDALFFCCFDPKHAALKEKAQLEYDAIYAQLKNEYISKNS